MFIAYSDKECSCCKDRKKIDKKVKSEKLISLPVKTDKKKDTILACSYCDGFLVQRALQNHTYEDESKAEGNNQE